MRVSTREWAQYARCGEGGWYVWGKEKESNDESDAEISSASCTVNSYGVMRMPEKLLDSLVMQREGVSDSELGPAANSAFAHENNLLRLKTWSRALKTQQVPFHSNEESFSDWRDFVTPTHTSEEHSWMSRAPERSLESRKRKKGPFIFAITIPTGRQLDYNAQRK